MRLIYGLYAPHWRKWVKVKNGIPTEYRQLVLLEDDWYGLNPPIATPVPSKAQATQGMLSAGSFILAAESTALPCSPMTEFAREVLEVVSRDHEKSAIQRSTDWNLIQLLSSPLVTSIHSTVPSAPGRKASLCKQWCPNMVKLLAESPRSWSCKMAYQEKVS
jgi:hypothetical protein